MSSFLLSIRMRVALRPLLAAICVWLFAGMSPAQAPAPDVDTLLREIADHTAHYRASMPSITANESIVSEGPGFLGRRRRTATAEMRVLAQENKDRFQESRRILSVDGKPGTLSKLDLPVLLSGAFGDFADVYFSPARAHCYLFSTTPTTPLRIDFRLRPGCKKHAHSEVGFAELDPATHQIVHLERVADVDASEKVASFASVDVAPARIGDETFWLPTRIVGEMYGGKSRFVATYSNYHRFTGTSRILPGFQMVDGPAPADDAQPVVPPAGTAPKL